MIQGCGLYSGLCIYQCVSRGGALITASPACQHTCTEQHNRRQWRTQWRTHTHMFTVEWLTTSDPHYSLCNFISYIIVEYLYTFKAFLKKPYFPEKYWHCTGLQVIYSLSIYFILTFSNPQTSKPQIQKGFKSPQVICFHLCHYLEKHCLLTKSENHRF